MPLALKDLFSKKGEVGFVYFESQGKRGTHVTGFYLLICHLESEERSLKACKWM